MLDVAVVVRNTRRKTRIINPLRRSSHLESLKRQQKAEAGVAGMTEVQKHVSTLCG
ncbi:hypothetical protein LCGC14_1833510 [marine sediment metagenome]|jgi:hypothetical protein|uniref:Uncharacterized protein n=1 Tax=marine sediment metagenome TaxID=412755 RepID=A0A0F9JEV1_9ZZZZ|tara:strand:+ start:42875 stop:43042 length:168 start_codon:yes stop_codon:yes gene_type:complete